MNEIQKSRVLRLAAGAIGGAASALARHRGLRAARSLPAPLRPTRPRRDPDAYLVEELAWSLRLPLPRDLEDNLALGLRSGYGAAAGAALALVTRRLRLRSSGEVALAGATLGVAVWALGYVGWMPRARLVPPVPRQGTTHAAVTALAFAAAGILATLPVLLLDRAERGARRERLVARLAKEVVS